MVAAGGGGDAIACVAVARALALPDPITVMSYSWDRLLIDPLPGPRGAHDFAGLVRVAPEVWQVQPGSQPIRPAGSSLPRLAASLPYRLLLMDPSDGAVGLATQIMSAATVLGADGLLLVDVGGDALTSGTDQGLRSPLADQLAIAACLRSGLPGRLVVAAPGVDGEIEPAPLHQRLADIGGQRLARLSPADFDPVRDVFAWHPSEASGLLLAAADGRRGAVEVRDAGDRIELTERTPELHAVEVDDLRSFVPGAALTDTESLAGAEHRIHELTGINEIRYETEKAARRSSRSPHVVTAADLDQVDQFADQAARRAANFISMRRLAELTGITSLDGYAALGRLLAIHRPDQYAVSLYAVR